MDWTEHRHFFLIDRSKQRKRHVQKHIQNDQWLCISCQVPKWNWRHFKKAFKNRNSVMSNWPNHKNAGHINPDSLHLCFGVGVGGAVWREGGGETLSAEGFKIFHTFYNAHRNLNPGGNSFHSNSPPTCF